MDLKTYLSDLSAEDREAFAKQCNTSVGHLRNICYGKTCAPVLATAIEQHSGGKVRRRQLREDWQAIWPELVKA